MSEEPLGGSLLRRITKPLAATTVVLAIGLAAATWAMIGRGRPPIPPPDDRRAMAEGAALYARHCASCHGAQLEGQPNWRDRKADGRLPAPPHDATGHTWHHSDDTLFRITKHGLEGIAPPGYVSDMPAFEKVLTDQEIAAILGYIKSVWPPDIRERQQRLSAASPLAGR